MTQGVRAYIAFPKQLRYTQILFNKVSSFENVPHQDGNRYIGLPTSPSELIIECKWQESGGSVDEKFPYLNLNIQNSYPAPTIVVIGGEGMREGAIKWLRNQVKCNLNLLAVYSLDRFIAWANKNC